LRQVLINTQGQTGKFTPGSSPTAKNRLLPSSRTQSRVVIGLLTGHNTLRRYL